MRSIIPRPLMGAAVLCDTTWVGVPDKSADRMSASQENLSNEIDLERSYQISAGRYSGAHLQRHRSVREDSIQPTAPRGLWASRLRQALQEVRASRDQR